jgi:hypothetical protein
VRVDAVEARPGVGVPELDAPVCGPTPGSEEVGLEGAPRQGLHGCLVLVHPVQGGGALGRVPNVQQVVVSPAGQLGAGGGPLEAADLLFQERERFVFLNAVRFVVVYLSIISSKILLEGDHLRTQISCAVKGQSLTVAAVYVILLSEKLT